ncbi:hypothetical protein Q672_09850 [Marinobacter sp. EVN1]|nr:hypothetical protein Q672_09850 [Marinobacter sp. EVN1]
MNNLSTPLPEQNRVRISTPLLARERRILTALLMGPVSREQADRIGRVSNSPQYIATLRSRGLTIACLRRTLINEDGTLCRPGIYQLSRDSIPLARELLSIACQGA